MLHLKLCKDNSKQWYSVGISCFGGHAYINSKFLLKEFEATHFRLNRRKRKRNANTTGLKCDFPSFIRSVGFRVC